MRPDRGRSPCLSRSGSSFPGKRSNASEWNIVFELVRGRRIRFFLASAVGIRRLEFADPAAASCSATAEELKGFFKSGAFAKNPIGVSFDPDELARKYHAGVPDAELKRYDAERGFDRDMMRQLGQ